MTEAIRDLGRWKELRKSEIFAGKTVGFVPTMGALHSGHASLLRKSREENDITVLSIFVNPTQFDDPADLRNYPVTLEKDFALARELGVDFILLPTPEEMYGDGFRFRVSETTLSQKLCGAFRPGHFEGVLTVVLKLLNLVRSDRAYFGEKDYQQYRLVREMAEALFLETEIVPCPIIREEDGLALSSRNVRLAPEERLAAAEFPKALRSSLQPDAVKKALEGQGFSVDYVENLDGRRLGAVRIGKVRLIDNVPAAR